MKYFSVFRQQRTHGCWEIVGLPVIPDRWLGESTRTYRYWEQHGTCASCDLVTRELATAARIIAADDEAVTLAPYAARHPFEVWILPRKHGSHFENAIGAQLDAAALALENVARQMDAVLARPDLLITLQTAGSQEIGHHGLLAHSHWRIEVIPMLLASTAPAAAGQFFVNPVPPEEAAKYLRES
jgi:UDPglucose--hexose-1-phosphate uridylyltransferase